MSLILVFLASLAGSGHCVAMCGGFSAIAANSNRSLSSQSLYHTGRLLTYLSLGFVAGVVGSKVDLLGSQHGLTHLATLLTAALLIISGIIGIIRGYTFTFTLVPHKVSLLVQTFVKPFKSRPLMLPLVLGLCTTLLPCGWLYTYLIFAAGSGSGARAMLIMAAFWLGSVPLLLLTGGLAAFISLPLKKYTPLIASLLMVLAGFFSLFTHLSHSDQSHSDQSHSDQSHAHSCAMHPASDMGQ